MHLTIREAVDLGRALVSELSHLDDREIALCPSFPALAGVAAILDSSPLRLAAQDLFWESEGAFTGEVSAAMLKEVGVTYVLIGHSERREHMGETDRMINRKVKAALARDLHPVICVGEKESARAAGRAASIVRTQLLRAREGVPMASAAQLAISYEPVWAIGTGRAASPGDATEMHASIRTALKETFGDAARRVRILYGGSVFPANIGALMESPGVDGVLVGGASLSAAEFTKIARYDRHG